MCTQIEFVKILKFRRILWFVSSGTLLLADVFENFGYMCPEIYELDPANFFSALGLAW